MNSQAKIMSVVENENISRVAASKAKRILDIAIAVLALLLLGPLFIGLAVAVRLSSPGPVLFKQKRSGLDSVPFEIYKFRSMKVHSENGVVTQARKSDDRVTRVGRFIRRTSLDELPQFINVLRGEMSVVGPRPHALAHDDIFSKTIDSYSRRFVVKPGITGWAQISGFRGETKTDEEMQERVNKDIFYIENWSVFFDLKIIVMTPLKIFHGNNY